MPTESIEGLINLAKSFKAGVEAATLRPSIPRRTLGLLFFENSTRTRVSFEQACHYLGHNCVNFSGAGSSMTKGESLKDTILTLKHERLEGIIVRHNASGACQVVSKYFDGPIVNAGDGRHEHPTQALGDALTILEKLGRINGLKVAIVGDVLHSRVARSNAWLLSKMGAEVRFVGPPNLLPNDVSMLPGKCYHDLRQGLEGVDVVMALRLQRERMEGGFVSIDGYRRDYQINRSAIRVSKPDVVIMHPGPMNRGIEIDDLTADGPQSLMNQQVSNGIFVRMAAISWAFDGFGEKSSLGGLA